MLVFPIFSLEAHEIRPGYLQIQQVSEEAYYVFCKIPRMGDAVPKIYVDFPEGFEVEELRQPNP
ncbi:MAG: hypothetical protein WBN69_14020, partial [Eudoraea sp.]